MPAPVRSPGETRQLIVELLQRSTRPMTWPEITREVGITAGYRTQKRMLDLGQIRLAGFDDLGTQLYSASSQADSQRDAINRRTTQPRSESPPAIAVLPAENYVHSVTRTLDDRPGMLAESAAVEQRRNELTKPHVAPLQRYVEELRKCIPSDRFVPNFDPWDGGIDASCLFLLEAPGPQAKASGFASRNNNSQTSTNLFQYSQDAGIDRRQTLMWNVVPWYIGTSNRIRPANTSDVREGVSHLLELTKLLPKLKLVVLFGEKAQKGQKLLAGALPALQFIPALHPSNVALNQKPENRSLFCRTLVTVANAIAQAANGG